MDVEDGLIGYVIFLFKGCTLHKEGSKHSNYGKLSPGPGLQCRCVPTFPEEVLLCFHSAAVRLDRGGRDLSGENNSDTNIHL